MPGSDYFSNHSMKLRFPWRLYHEPIARELGAELDRVPSARVLNVGSGPFFELATLPHGARTYTLCDIDPRAVRLAREIHGSRLAGADVLGEGGALPYADGAFDLVAAMDVIEHVVDPGPWLRDVWRVVAPGGLLFLTTPNYGSLGLRVLEATALEAIARVQGFSRRDIHPTKFDAARLAGALAALPGGRSVVRAISYDWVLLGTVRRSPDM